MISENGGVYGQLESCPYALFSDVIGSQSDRAKSNQIKSNQIPIESHLTQNHLVSQQALLGGDFQNVNTSSKYLCL
jgi:hypothetical protein